MGKRKKREREAPAAAPRRVMARAVAMDSPEFLEFVRGGAGTVSIESALENSAVLRCVDLISGAIGMLPLSLVRQLGDGSMEVAEEHPVHRLLALRPNDWQTPFEFKQVMQVWALAEGNAYALPIRSLGRTIALVPIEPSRVMVEQRPDWSLVYRVTTAGGGVRELGPRDVFHLRGFSRDGITGTSRVRKAGRIIQTALSAQRAADRLFRQGVMAGGALSHPHRLGPEGVQHLQESLERYSGIEAAGKWMILEEGMKAEVFPTTAEDSQMVEIQGALVEDIARMFGVPRPLMGVDDTSWGSGVEQLAILFVRFGLAPWFKAWEEAIRRTLLEESEWLTLAADFDERELLRGTLKDQAEFFARALGSGGHPAWMTQNEVREQSGMGRRADGEGLKQGAAPAPQKSGEADDGQKASGGAGA